MYWWMILLERFPKQHYCPSTSVQIHHKETCGDPNERNGKHDESGWDVDRRPVLRRCDRRYREGGRPLASHKRHWLTSLRQMAVYLDRPLSLIPTRIAAIGEAIKKLHPAYLGVGMKTFMNHRPNTRSALLWFNKQRPFSGRKAAMDPSYRALLDQVEDRYAKDMLSPFFRFLSASQIPLQEVRDCHVEAFQAYRRETSFGRVKRTQHRSLVRFWNDCAKGISDWLLALARTEAVSIQDIERLDEIRSPSRSFAQPALLRRTAGSFA
jgi:hypothetical protein